MNPENAEETCAESTGNGGQPKVTSIFEGIRMILIPWQLNLFDHVLGWFVLVK
jgi:hypothetical protein